MTERLYLPRDLAAVHGVQVKTVAKWRREKKLPPFDVRQSLRSRGWWASTLRKAGLLPAA